MTTLAALAEVTPAAPTVGDGSEANPYQITSVEEFCWFRDAVNAGTGVSYHAKLMADIDLTEACNSTVGNWMPIGLNEMRDANLHYDGIFDGNNKTVRNLYIAKANGSSGYNGLFGRLEGTVKNLTVCGNVYGSSYIGFIVGFAESGATISNCQAGEAGSSSVIEGIGNYIGGVVGQCRSGSITDCRNYATVRQSDNGSFVGGICGSFDYPTAFERCANYGEVTSTYNYVGGIAGWLRANSSSASYLTVKDFANYGNVTGTNFVGSLAGYTKGLTLRNCFNTGNVNAAGKWSSDGQYGTFSGFFDEGTKFIHCYSLATATITGTGIRLKDSYPCIIDAETVKSGAITCQFNAESDCWGQSLASLTGTGDNYPVFGKNKKVYITNPTAVYFDCPNQLPTGGKYTNSMTSAGSYSDIETHHNWDEDLDLCTTCFLSNEPETYNDGSKDIYRIRKLGHLVWFRDAVNSGQNKINGRLYDNIDLGMVCGETIGSWEPIGSYEKPFMGSFDGDGNTISNLYVNKKNGYAGLFGYTKDVSIQSLKLSRATVKGSDAGALVGYVSYKSKTSVISCVEVDGSCTVEATNYAGGIVGNANRISIDLCVNSAEVTGVYCAGGIAGYMYNVYSNLTECHNLGTIKSNSAAGGIAGRIYLSISYNKVYNCANYGSVSGSTQVGGLFGYLSNPTGTTASITKIQNCLSVGNVTGSGTVEIGKFIGYAQNPDNFDNLSTDYVCANSVLTIAGKAADVHIGNSDKTVNSVSSAELASGKIAYEIQERNTADGIFWGQKIGHHDYPYSWLVKEDIPVVYYYNKDCQGNEFTPVIYSNIAGYKKHADLDEDGLCPICGGGATPELDDEGRYLIANAGHLKWLSDYVNIDNTDDDGKCVVNARQIADIDLSSVCSAAEHKNWNPIGKDDEVMWAGEYDGGGHKITGLYINRNNIDYGYYQGLFGYTTSTDEGNSHIYDLSVDGTITAYSASGLVVGYAKYTDINNIKTTGSITGINNYIGGVAGFSNAGIISGCNNDAFVLNRNTLNTGYESGNTSGYGGIVGYYSNNANTVNNCFNSGRIDAGNSYCVGGVIGYYAGSFPSLSCCANVGAITGSDYTAGLAGEYGTDGFTSDVWAIKCYNYGTVELHNGTDGKHFGDIFALPSTDAILSDHVRECYILGGAGDASESNIYARDVDDFANGRVAYSLIYNGDQPSPWGQTLDINKPDPYPVINGYRVYAPDGFSNYSDGKASIGDVTYLIDRQKNGLPVGESDIESVKTQTLGGWFTPGTATIYNSDYLTSFIPNCSVNVEIFPDNRLIVKNFAGVPGRDFELLYNNSGKITKVIYVDTDGTVKEVDTTEVPRIWTGREDYPFITLYPTSSSSYVNTSKTEGGISLACVFYDGSNYTEAKYYVIRW